MARDPLTQAAVTCGVCGAKVAPGRRRCPRCTNLLDVPAAAAPVSGPQDALGPVGQAPGAWRTWGPAAVLCCAAAALLLATTGRGCTNEPSAGVAARDPLEARRLPRNVEGRPAAAAEMPGRWEAGPAASAHAAYAAGDLESALAHYGRAVKERPRDADAWSNMGQVLVRLNRVREAVSCFERALALDADRWTYHFNLARAHGLLGSWDAAVAGYRKASALFPGDYVTSFNLGLALHKTGDEAAAIEAYERAIQGAPADASFRLALGISLEAHNRGIDAAAAYAEYLRLDPGGADADKVRERIAWLTRTPAAPAGVGASPPKPTGG